MTVALHITYMYCYVLTEIQLRKMSKKARGYRRQAFSEGTTSNRQTHLKSFFLFVTYFSLNSFPVSGLVLERYIVFLSQTITVAFIVNYLSTLRFVHILHQLPFPAVNSVQIHMLLRGLKKVLKTPTKQVLPILPDMLLQMFQFVDLTDQKQLSLWTSFVIAFFIFARKSNMCPPSRSSFSRFHHLQRKDIKFCSSGLIIHIKWAKNLLKITEIIL